MKAFVRISPENQKVELIDVPVPEIKPDEVLVKVEAFGVGIHDRYFIPSKASFPYPIGSEGAGVITKLGRQITNFKEGDRVIFTTVLRPNGGSWAEYTAADQSTLIPMPANVTFAQGATVPVAGKTALESMRALQLQNGDRLFIAGASGAIGTLVIQLAAKKGIHVSASASEKNHNYMKALGAVKTVDYHDSDWQSQIKEWAQDGVTAALAIQPGTGIDSIKVVQDGGRLITVSGDNTQVPPERGIHISQMGHSAETKQDVVRLVDDIATGEIQIVIEKEYPFEQALEALEKTETRHARGKLIVNGKV
jgi:NADPH:quinone reductase-like Zn-dependent oxidoreductase